MRFKPNSQSSRMLAHIVTLGDAQFALADLQIGAFAGMPLRQISSIIHGLIAIRLVRRHGAHRGARYSGIQTAIAEHFAKMDQAQQFAERPAADRPAKKTKAAKPTIPPLFGKNTYCTHRLASAQIAADIDAFKRNGGRIEKLSPTARSRPIGDYE